MTDPRPETTDPPENNERPSAAARPPGVESPRRRRKAGCFLRAAVFALLLALVAAAAAAWFFARWTQRPGAPSGGPPVALEIVRGQSMKQIAERLEALRIARPAPLFILLARTEGLAGRIQAGEYLLERGRSPRDVLARLAEGPRDRSVRVTLPEGWTTAQMARRLAETGAIADAGAFLDAASDPGVLERLGIAASGAEGRLFPDTYFLRPLTPPAEALTRLHARFLEVIAELDLQTGQEEPHAAPLTFAEGIVLASIIEREARRADEMPLIASVFHNRLRRGMRLQSCATVRHALDKWDAPLTRSDLNTGSPFNTYEIAGLPPAPICNPGRAALEAAFRPAESSYLYYVYRGEGRHAFSETLREHEAARRRYKDAWRFSASQRRPETE